MCNKFDTDDNTQKLMDDLKDMVNMAIIPWDARPSGIGRQPPWGFVSSTCNHINEPRTLTRRTKRTEKGGSQSLL